MYSFGFVSWIYIGFSFSLDADVSKRFVKRAASGRWLRFLSRERCRDGVKRAAG